MGNNDKQPAKLAIQVQAKVSVPKPNPTCEFTETEKLVLTHVKLPLKLDVMSRYMFDANNNMIAETRGWGWIQYKQQAETIQDTLGEMFIKSFNKVYGNEQREA